MQSPTSPPPEIRGRSRKPRRLKKQLPPFQDPRPRKKPTREVPTNSGQWFLAQPAPAASAEQLEGGWQKRHRGQGRGGSAVALPRSRIRIAASHGARRSWAEKEASIATAGASLPLLPSRP